MIKIVGVRFRKPEKFIILIPRNWRSKRETTSSWKPPEGWSTAVLSSPGQEVAEDQVVQPLKAVIRIANAEDDKAEREIKRKKRRPILSVRRRSKSTVWR